MPIDQKALREFIGAVRSDEEKYMASAVRAQRLRRVVGAAGPGTDERGLLAEAITGAHRIGEDPQGNRFFQTRTVELLRGIISEDEIHKYLDGEGGPDVGLQKIAQVIYDRLGKLGMGEKARGEFLGDVMNRFEAGLAQKR